ncbi:MAG: 8-amino-7-oxononanoate synthase [Sphingobacteriia bacterium]|nr:MAG: 8-amino-7-oxononanoate synthase [Sphingobacteriia bacterium]
MYADDFLLEKLTLREADGALRSLKLSAAQIDFCSNDYLGLANQSLLGQLPALPQGATGSRLLSGNHPIHEKAEALIAQFHQVPAAVLFNSGYDANLGLLSAIAQKEDTILYDVLSHASIRDGIRLSRAQSFAFPHQDLSALEERLKKTSGRIFVVTESVFSMDGDMAPLHDMVQLCESHGAHLVVDEAHALGVIGEKGEGLVQHLGLADKVFARIVTFGKAAGVHGAAVLGSKRLASFLVNFARSLVYSTALSPHAVAAILRAYEVFPLLYEGREKLKNDIDVFRSAPLPFEKINSLTPIQGVKVGGNLAAQQLAARCQAKNLDVRPILYPTVPKGTERIRIILHAFNAPAELKLLLEVLTGPYPFSK